MTIPLSRTRKVWSSFSVQELIPVTPDSPETFAGEGFPSYMLMSSGKKGAGAGFDIEDKGD